MIIDIDTILSIYELEYIKEFKFHPSRKWRFDYVIIPEDEKIAIEFEGGVWSGGRHTRGSGYSKDCEKYNAAQCLGWRVLRYTSDILENEPEKIIKDIMTLRKKSN